MPPTTPSTPTAYSTRRAKKDADEVIQKDTLRSVCVNCLEEVPHLGIECAVCVKPRVRLCVHCHVDGAELGPHKIHHQYRFFFSGRCDLGRVDTTGNNCASEAGPSSAAPVWYDEEQLRLLTAMEKYGYSNWEEVSNLIATKSAEEAKQEYSRRYVHGTLGKLTWSGVKAILPIDHTIKPSEPLIPGGTSSNTVPVGPLSPSLMTVPIPLGSRKEMRELGGHCGRDDFEIEYDNNAEQLLRDISFDLKKDSEEEISVKLAVVDIYVGRMRERARRKQVVREYQLIPKFLKNYRKEQQQKEAASGMRSTCNSSRGRAVPSTSASSATNSSSSGGGGSGGRILPSIYHTPPTERGYPKEFLTEYRTKLEGILQPFTQFMTRKEFDNVTDSMVQEQELIFRIQQLYKYRKLGLKTAAEAEEYELQKQKREGEAQTDKKKESGSSKGMLETVSEESEEDDEEDDDEEVVAPKNSRKKVKIQRNRGEAKSQQMEEAKETSDSDSEVEQEEEDVDDDDEELDEEEVDEEEGDEEEEEEEEDSDDVTERDWGNEPKAKGENEDDDEEEDEEVGVQLDENQDRNPLRDPTNPEYVDENIPAWEILREMLQDEITNDEAGETGVVGEEGGSEDDVPVPPKRAKRMQDYKEEVEGEEVARSDSDEEEEQLAVCRKRARTRKIHDSSEEDEAGCDANEVRRRLRRTRKKVQRPAVQEAEDEEDEEGIDEDEESDAVVDDEEDDWVEDEEDVEEDEEELEEADVESLKNDLQGIADSESDFFVNSDSESESWHSDSSSESAPKATRSRARRRPLSRSSKPVSRQSSNSRDSSKPRRKRRKGLLVNKKSPRESARETLRQLRRAQTRARAKSNRAVSSSSPEMKIRQPHKRKRRNVRTRISVTPVRTSSGGGGGESRSDRVRTYPARKT